jgi:hypothetical protein
MQTPKLTSSQPKFGSVVPCLEPTSLQPAPRLIIQSQRLVLVWPESQALRRPLPKVEYLLAVDQG